MKSSRRNIICICHRRFVTKYAVCHIPMTFFLLSIQYHCDRTRNAMCKWTTTIAYLRLPIGQKRNFYETRISRIVRLIGVWIIVAWNSKVSTSSHGPQKAINEFIENWGKEKASAVAIVEWTTTTLTEELITTAWICSKTGCRRTHSHTNMDENLIRGTMEKQ